MAEKLKVIMDDGEEMLFNGLDANKPRAQRMKKAIWEDEDTGEIHAKLSFRNGRILDMTLPENLLIQTAMHGLSQKLGDEIAGVADVEDCFIEMEGLISRLQAGEWTAPKKKGSGAGASMLVAALIEVTGKSIDIVKDFLSGKTGAEKTALKNSEKVRPIILRLQEEKAKKKAEKDGIDTSAMLDELNI